MNRTKTKCPSCRSSTFTIYERLEVSHSHYVENGVVHPVDIADGLPTHIGYAASCLCGHTWVPRKITADAIIDRE